MKRNPRLALRIQAAFCVLVICIVFLAIADFTISGTVRDGDGAGIDNARESIMVDLFGAGHGGQPSGNVKYAQASYNMFPVIQMNTSWKRASKMEPITFDSGDTYDPDGYIKAYEWTFGDGNMTEGKVVEHAFKEEGRYTVRLRVVDNNGTERSAYVTAIISNEPPVAVPGNDTNATAGEAIEFNGSASYDPDGNVVKYEWAFGDGTTGQGAAVMHAYTRPDKYKAELKVTDDSGANATAYWTVNVSGTAAAPVPAKSGSSQGILLLAGAGVALKFLIRKKGR